MDDPRSQPQWMSVAEASRALKITETAVRKRIQSGVLSARGERGKTEVLISVANSLQLDSQLIQSGLGSTESDEVARLERALAELRAHLADAQLDRDRWYAAAIEARDDARAEAAARRAAERELRLLLGGS